MALAPEAPAEANAVEHSASLPAFGKLKLAFALPAPASSFIAALKLAGPEVVSVMLPLVMRRLEPPAVSNTCLGEPTVMTLVTLLTAIA